MSANPQAALAGLWLYFSCRDQAHTIAQDVNDRDGSYWHAIIHRQEPDAGNSAYWFRQMGAHPAFPQLLEAAREIVTSHQGPEHALILKDRWDPFAFIDFCEQARSRPESPAGQLALQIQRAEWQLLFDHCARARS